MEGRVQAVAVAVEPHEERPVFSYAPPRGPAAPGGPAPGPGGGGGTGPGAGAVVEHCVRVPRFRVRRAEILRALDDGREGEASGAEKNREEEEAREEEKEEEDKQDDDEDDDDAGTQGVAAGQEAAASKTAALRAVSALDDAFGELDFARSFVDWVLARDLATFQTQAPPPPPETQRTDLVVALRRKQETLACAAAAITQGVAHLSARARRARRYFSELLALRDRGWELLPAGEAGALRVRYSSVLPARTRRPADSADGTVGVGVGVGSAGGGRGAHETVTLLSAAISGGAADHGSLAAALFSTPSGRARCTLSDDVTHSTGPGAVVGLCVSVDGRPQPPLSGVDWEEPRRARPSAHPRGLPAELYAVRRSLLLSDLFSSLLHEVHRRAVADDACVLPGGAVAVRCAARGADAPEGFVVAISRRLATAAPAALPPPPLLPASPSGDCSALPPPPAPPPPPPPPPPPSWDFLEIIAVSGLLAHDVWILPLVRAAAVHVAMVREVACILDEIVRDVPEFIMRWPMPAEPQHTPFSLVFCGTVFLRGAVWQGALAHLSCVCGQAELDLVVSPTQLGRFVRRAVLRSAVRRAALHCSSRGLDVRSSGLAVRHGRASLVLRRLSAEHDGGAPRVRVAAVLGDEAGAPDASPALADFRHVSLAEYLESTAASWNPSLPLRRVAVFRAPAPQQPPAAPTSATATAAAAAALEQCAPSLRRRRSSAAGVEDADARDADADAGAEMPPRKQRKTSAEPSPSPPPGPPSASPAPVATAHEAPGRPVPAPACAPASDGSVGARTARVPRTRRRGR